MDIYLIGNNAILNYEKEILGNDLSALEDIVSGNSPFCERIENSEYPLIIIGMSALKDEFYASTQSLIYELIKKYPQLMSIDNDWNGISYLQTRSNRNAALDIGFVPGPNINKHDNDSIKLLYLLDNNEFDETEIPEDTFVIYQGSHGDKGALIADVILPGMSFIEKNGTYVNVDGRVQRTTAAVSAPGQSRIDWQIIRALSEMCGVPLKYDNIDELRERLNDIIPHFAKIDTIDKPYINYKIINEYINTNTNNDNITITNKKFDKYHTDYFQTDHVTRASPTLKKAQKTLKMSNNSFY